MTDEIKDKIDEIESKLIEQEHRPLTVLTNFFIQRKKWSKGDPKRDAATKALIWRMFFSPATVAATGGIIAIFSLIVLVWQNQIITDQNSLISKQNNFFQAQIKQQDDQYKLQRRTELIGILYGTSPSNSRVRTEALIEFIELERSQYKNDSTSIKIKKVIDLSPINLSNAKLQEVILENNDLSNVNFEGADFSNARLNACNFSNCDLGSANFNSASLEGGDLKNAFIYEANFENSAINFVQNVLASDFCETIGNPRRINIVLKDSVNIICPERLNN